MERTSYGYDDIRLEPSDNGGFILRFSEYWKPMGAKSSDNIQCDYGKSYVYTSDQLDQAISDMQKMAAAKRKK